ncbi:unnamed protein product, partial [Medioppia subpectinata]
KCLNSDQMKANSPNVKKVFIQRDYSEGTDIKFQMKFPQELEEYIDRQSFEHLIDTLNTIYSDAETMSGRTCCESCLACITAYLTYICFDTYYDKKCLNSDQMKANSPNVKKVFIQRDYSEGTDIKFQMKFPQELEEYIDRQSFEHLIDTLNTIYSDAETMSGRTCCESCLACITAYLTYICFDTYYDKCLKKVSAFIDEQNDTIWKPRNLYVTDPIERGLRVIEIVIYEPMASHPTADHPNADNTNSNSVTNNRKP